MTQAEISVCNFVADFFFQREKYLILFVDCLMKHNYVTVKYDPCLISQQFWANKMPYLSFVLLTLNTGKPFFSQQLGSSLSI